MTAIATPDTHAIRDFEITNTCQCSLCAECSIGYVGHDDSPCDECGGRVEYSVDCFDCFSDDKAIITETARAWFAANPAPQDVYIIEGAGMGWRGRSGVKAIASGADVSKAISVDAEWTQFWSIDPKAEGEFKATQAHHDAMGEAYVVRPAMEDEAQDWSDCV